MRVRRASWEIGKKKVLSTGSSKKTFYINRIVHCHDMWINKTFHKDYSSNIIFALALSILGIVAPTGAPI